MSPATMTEIDILRAETLQTILELNERINNLEMFCGGIIMDKEASHLPNLPDRPGEYYFRPKLLVQVKLEETQDGYEPVIYWGDIRLGLVRSVCGVWQKK